MRALALRLAPSAVAGLLVLAQSAGASPQDGASAAAERAVASLLAGTLPTGELDVLAELRLDEEEPDASLGPGKGDLAVLVSGLGSVAAGERWRITVAVADLEGPPQVAQTIVAWPAGASGSGWAYLSRTTLPHEFDEGVVLVESLAAGRSGAAWVELAADLPAPPEGFVVVGGGEEVAAEDAIARDREEPAGSVLRLIAPAERPLVGRVRFRVVTSTDAVRAVRFFLDGEEVAIDERPAFSAVIDLGAEPRPRTVRAVAFGLRDLELGADSVTVNLETQPFRVRLGAVEELGPERRRVAVEVSVPPGERLAAVEVYRNDELVARLDRPPFVTEIVGPVEASDFVRAVARLASGEEREDARLLAAEAMAERVEVNLVEVYAVVTDRDGMPVTGLGRERFRLRQGRREVPIEGFGPAEEVPLVLGLIVDSSESMYPLMVETQQAAATFFSDTVRSDDRGYLVDFDTRPRLAQPLTGDLGALLGSLRVLSPGGNTAIYDAAIFSLGQFEAEPGRRALVVLTDGRDYGSRFRPSQVVDEARRLGVPIYVIVLNNLGFLREAWRQRDLEPPPVDANVETLALKTGGRLFNLAGTAELVEVYRTINLELRSQYLVTFSTEEPLTTKELGSLTVSVDGKGLEARTVTLDR